MRSNDLCEKTCEISIFSKIWSSTSEKSIFCPDKTCFAAQILSNFFQNHIIIMISDIKTQFSLETFHPETNRNILQKSKFSKNNFKIIICFKRFFIAKGSLSFSNFWNPEEECFRAEAERLRLTLRLRVRVRMRPRLWLMLMLRLTHAEAQAEGGWDGALTQTRALRNEIWY